MNVVPLWKPTYGRVTAIDLNTGDHLRMSPVGDLAQSVPALQQLGLSHLGRAARGHLLLTQSLLVVGQEGSTQHEGGPEQCLNFRFSLPTRSHSTRLRASRLGGVAVTQRDCHAMTYMLKGK